MATQKLKTMRINVDRKFNNVQIMLKITIYLENNPEMRFGQALIALGVVDEKKVLFYEEPSEMIERMNKIKQGESNG